MVRLDTGTLAVVIAGRPTDRFPALVEGMMDRAGAEFDEFAIIEAIDLESVAVDPLKYL